MRVAGLAESQRALQQDLAGCREQQVRTAHHLSDPLKGIVDDDGELIGVDAVGAPQYEVAGGFLDNLLLWSLDAVFEGERARRSAEALGACPPPERKTVPAGAGVNGSLGSRAAGSGNLGAAASARIGQTPSRECVECISVDVGPKALMDHGFIPFETERAQGAEDQVCRPGNLARAVEVFHSHQPNARIGAGVRVAGHGGEQRAEMEWTGRGRRKAAAIRASSGGVGRTGIGGALHRPHDRDPSPAGSGIIRAAVRGSRRVSCSRCRVWRSAAPRDGGCRSRPRRPRRSRSRGRRFDRAPRRSS